jgi:hypothetical protein
MIRVRTVGLCAALLVAVMTTSSCRLFRRSAKAQPLPAPISVPAAQPAPRQVSLPQAPELPAEPPEIDEAPSVPPETVPPPPRRRVSVPRPRPAPDPAPEPVPVPPPSPGSVPQLGQMLSPQQQQAYNEEIDRNIAQAQRALGNLNGRRLTSEQQTYLDRIHAFVQQALDARKSDLFRARTLAERASLLAADLSRTLQ